VCVCVCVCLKDQEMQQNKYFMDKMLLSNSNLAFNVNFILILDIFFICFSNFLLTCSNCRVLAADFNLPFEVISLKSGGERRSVGSSSQVYDRSAHGGSECE